MYTTTTVAILGAGSFGTAIAIHLARAGNQVKLFSHDTAHVAAMCNLRCNQRYLPQFNFPDTLYPYANLLDCIHNAEHIIIAVPSHAFAAILCQLPDNIGCLSWLTKGIDPNTNQLFSSLIAQRFGNNLPIAVISGPSFAKEVAAQLPTALVVAGNDAVYTHKVQALLHHAQMRIYFSDDYIGIQWCGAIKNILAIACGISDGLNYGANAKAALITRGLEEMRRFGSFFHAHIHTFLGLAGVGDLVLTCTDDQSRNRRFGLLLGAGVTSADAIQQIGQVVEGAHNAAQIVKIAAHNHIDMPICNAVHAILTNNITPQQAVSKLMHRPKI